MASGFSYWVAALRAAKLPAEALALHQLFLRQHGNGARGWNRVVAESGIMVPVGKQGLCALAKAAQSQVSEGVDYKDAAACLHDACREVISACQVCGFDDMPDGGQTPRAFGEWLQKS